MGSLDCNEFANLKSRDFKEYSLGHRIMYEVPIRLMSGERRRILDVGFGIGWGLDQMLKAAVISSYVGYEPNKESFEYVRSRINDPRVSLINAPFTRPVKNFDQVFCIEVAEHVPMDGHADFLADLRAACGGTLWFSSPDVRRYPSEGVRTPDEWANLLNLAGFDAVTVHKDQWTALLVAQ